MCAMVLVHAHPDDETITCGGVMALATATGVKVTLITCTLGELGEVIPSELAHLEGNHLELADHRANELASACGALGVTDHRLLGGRSRWKDSGMVATGEGVRATAPADLGPGAFARPDAAEEQVDQLAEVLRETCPQVVVSYDASGGYGHPDHVRAHTITQRAVEAVDPLGKRIGLYATVMARQQVAAGLAALRRRPRLRVPVPRVDDLATVPDAIVTSCIALERARLAKLAALRAHATQVSVMDDDQEPPVYVLSNGLAQPVLADEHFALLRGPGALEDLLGR